MSDYDRGGGKDEEAFIGRRYGGRHSWAEDR
jgi:hypothetical protein